LADFNRNIVGKNWNYCWISTVEKERWQMLDLINLKLWVLILRHSHKTRKGDITRAETIAIKSESISVMMEL
jgi:hypothetical protein